MDLMVVVIMCAVLFFVNHALKLSVRALEHTIKQKKESTNLSEKEEEKLNDRGDSIEQSRTVLYRLHICKRNYYGIACG